jgi:SpoU rRNA methylase family enzyme
MNAVYALFFVCREEKILKLEQQLRNAYGSMGRAALRASGNAALEGVAGSVRISRLGAVNALVAQSLDETIEVPYAAWPRSGPDPTRPGRAGPRVRA